MQSDEINVLCSLFSGTTEKTLIEVLTQRSNAQRQLIAKAYQKATGRVHGHSLSHFNCDCREEDADHTKRWVTRSVL